jgi:predicted RNA binding protein YcfA (HicA-like mRNA interferase family)
MNSMSGKELAKLLESNGWILLRVQGSHTMYTESLGLLLGFLYQFMEIKI